MAKVTLILEDVKEADGTDGLLIDWQGDDFEKDSIAHSYAEALVEHILGQAKMSEILDKNAILITPPKASEEDPGLN